MFDRPIIDRLATVERGGNDGDTGCGEVRQIERDSTFGDCLILHDVSLSCGVAISHDSEGAGLRQSPRTPHHCTLCETSTPGEIAACTCVDCPNRQKEAA